MIIAEVGWNILVFLFWVLVILGAIIIVAAVIVGAVRAVNGWFPKRSEYLRNAAVESERIYQNGILEQDSQEAFYRGAKWGWDQHHKLTRRPSDPMI